MVIGTLSCILQGLVNVITHQLNICYFLLFSDIDHVPKKIFKVVLLNNVLLNNVLKQWYASLEHYCYIERAFTP